MQEESTLSVASPLWNQIDQSDQDDVSGYSFILPGDMKSLRTRQEDVEEIIYPITK